MAWDALLLAGGLGDRLGRKRLLIAGWLFGRSPRFIEQIR